MNVGIRAEEECPKGGGFAGGGEAGGTGKKAAELLSMITGRGEALARKTGRRVSTTRTGAEQGTPRPAFHKGVGMSMRRQVFVGLLGMVALILVGCAVFGPPQTATGPGVPHIANLRFDPDVVRIGETARMSFYFEVGSADIEEGFLIERGISQFQFYQSLNATPIDLRKYIGVVADTVEIPFKWSNEGVRLFELYVVTQKGNASNRLRATVTVR